MTPANIPSWPLRTGTRAAPHCSAFPPLQLALFDPEDFAGTAISDQLHHWGLVDIKALAMDPEVRIRRLAALSRMNIDSDLQLTLASDPDEQVVLALLGRVDPCAAANRLIIEGPHVTARRILASRNLTTASLELLALDTDHEASAAARRQLTARGVCVLEAV